MIDDEKQSYELSQLVLELIDGSIDSDRLELLGNYLSQSPEAVDMYRDLMRNVVVLKRRIPIVLSSDKELFDPELWSALADYEKAAPMVEIPAAAPPRESAPEVVILPREHRRLSKLEGFLLVMSTAAMLLMFLWIQFAPEKQVSVEVATLVDQVDARWSRVHAVPSVGSRLLSNSDSLELREGFIKLRFDEGVDVMVEGPARFEIDQLGLYREYGRVYTHVSETGYGFTVRTPTTLCVDMGTEFGVHVEEDGSSELHVLKGLVQIKADAASGAGESQIIGENRAVRYNAGSDHIKPIPIKTNAFARQVDSRSRVVWRGQSHIDLADFVGRGDGFGTGRLRYGVDPFARSFKRYDGSQLPGIIRFHNGYQKFTQSAFIDGLFVPNSAEGPQIISSMGHVFKECPETIGEYYLGVVNGRPIEAHTFREMKLSLDGVAYGSFDRSALFMHSNQGITFDLNAIRDGLVDMRFNRFSSLCGITETAKHGLTDVYVLVDGEVRFRREGMQPGQSFNIDVPLSGRDQFLTLISVTSRDKQRSTVEGELLPLNFDDWFLFGEPRLVLEQ